MDEMICGMCHSASNYAAKTFFFFAFSPSFFSDSCSSLLFGLSLVREDPDTCFDSKHTEEASSCNNMTMNTKGCAPDFFLQQLYGVSFYYVLPSLTASSPLKRDVWKKDYVYAAIYTQFGNSDVKSYAVDFNNGSPSLRSTRVNWLFSPSSRNELEAPNLSSSRSGF